MQIQDIRDIFYPHMLQIYFTIDGSFGLKYVKNKKKTKIQNMFEQSRVNYLLTTVRPVSLSPCMHVE